MSMFTRFTVLIERRRLRRTLALGLASLTLIMTVGIFSVKAVNAGTDKRPTQARSKVSVDLDQAITAFARPNRKWVKDIKGQRHIQAIVVSNSTDPKMTDLRAEVMRGGGSVHALHPAMRAITVQMSAGRLQALAQRSDVVSITPNRDTQRTASSLESISGALSGARSNSTKTSYTGLDGSGIGIAILDSGVMKAHEGLMNSGGSNRVKRNVTMLNDTQANWTTGVDSATSLEPGSVALNNYEKMIAADSLPTQDGYGHGTHVASVAAGRAALYSAGTPDTTGIAPNANIYDVKVLNDVGQGTLSDALEGIQWVIYHAKEYNIRVLNISLASASTETWQTDPLCVAVRSAAAAGITVVVSAGNYGLDANGKQLYGTVGSPGNDPSVITVGALNTHDTVARSDDTVNNFSSRGPTRGSYIDVAGVRVVDNLLKPDLVAPGNKIVSAAASTASSAGLTWNYLASHFASNLVTPLGITQTYLETQMMMTGTSVSAPVVSGAVALLLQANPGLTPPLIKAILQYTAQPLPNYNLLQQGAGMLNISGAVALAKALRTDLNTAINAGTINAGQTMLASGALMPRDSSTINGASFNWSRMAFVGGTTVVSGSALFTQYQPIWDPRITWAGNVVRKRDVVYWPSASLSYTSTDLTTYPQTFVDVAAPNQRLLTWGVIRANSLAGVSSMIGKTGVFMPTYLLSSWLMSGSGLVMSEVLVMSGGLVMSESILFGEP